MSGGKTQNGTPPSVNSIHLRHTMFSEVTLFISRYAPLTGDKNHSRPLKNQEKNSFENRQNNSTTFQPTSAGFLQMSTPIAQILALLKAEQRNR